jgi:hypothetical protein
VPGDTARASGCTSEEGSNLPKRENGHSAAIPARESAQSQEAQRELDRALQAEFLLRLREERLLRLSGFTGEIVGRGDDAALIRALLEFRDGEESR